jgi:vitellogenic carboxypeptidase-like protein
MVEFLVKKSKVLSYQGHFDLRDGVVSAEAWVKTMEWEGLGNYLMAERKAWKVKGVLAGYVQKWGSFSNTAVLEAGHSQVMIEDWASDFRVANEQGEDSASDFRVAVGNQ